MKLQLTILVGLCLVLVSPLAAQQAKPSAENAHGFLSEVLGRGSASASIADDVYGTIKTIESRDCTSEFTGEYKDYPPVSSGMGYWNIEYRFTLEWDKVSEVKVSEGAVRVRGAVPYFGTCESNTRKGCSAINSGTAVQATIRLETDAMAERIGNAMDVLRESCDSASRYGF